MNLLTHQTAKLEGSVVIPSSKSQSIRALMIATMACGESHLHHVLEAQDTEDAIRMCRSFGAVIEKIEPACHGFCLSVKSKGVPFKNREGGVAVPATMQDFFSGNSGLTTLFSLPLFGLRENFQEPAFLDCGEQMRKRPFQPLMKALQELGLHIEPDHFPLQISGQLKGGKVEIDGNNSQYLSALLLAAPYAKSPVEIMVKNLQERPYVEMTLQWLRRQQIQFEHVGGPHSTHSHSRHDSTSATVQVTASAGNPITATSNTDLSESFYVKPGQKYQPFAMTIPGDFSSASYFLAAGALFYGTVTLEGLDPDDPQGDKKLISILQEMGADITIRARTIVIRGGRKLRGISIDAGEIPDLVPTLAVLGTQAEGKTTIYNAAHARIKETDRLTSMATELKKMGAEIEEKPDGLIIQKSQLYGCSLHGYDDHRTIMALTIAGLLAEGSSDIDTAEGIKKTFPQFIDLMQKLGGQLTID